MLIDSTLNVIGLLIRDRLIQFFFFKNKNEYFSKHYENSHVYF